MKKLMMPLVAMLVASVFLGGCKKKEETPAPKTNAELIKGTWYRYEEYSTDLNGANLTKSNIQDCNTDDLYYFLEQGVYKVTKGTKKCYDGDSDNLGTYTLFDNDSKIEIKDINGDGESYSIENLTETELKFKIVDKDGIYYYTFKKK